MTHVLRRRDLGTSLVTQLVNIPPEMRKKCAIPRLGRSSGEGNGYPLQYSGLPGEFHGLFSPWGRKELDTTKRLSLSLMVQWLRLLLPLQGMQVQSLFRELRPTCLLAKKPKHRTEAIV